MALRILRRRQPILGGIPPYSFRRVRPAIITPTMGRFPGRVYAFRIPSPGGTGPPPSANGPARVTIVSRQAARPPGRIITSRAFPPTVVISNRISRPAIVMRPATRFAGRVIGGRLPPSAGSRLPSPVIVSRPTARFAGHVTARRVRSAIILQRMPRPTIIERGRMYPRRLYEVYGVKLFRVPGPSLFSSALVALTVSASEDGYELSGGEG